MGVIVVTAVSRKKRWFDAKPLAIGVRDTVSRRTVARGLAWIAQQAQSPFFRPTLK
jgi:hypothetical protein